MWKHNCSDDRVSVAVKYFQQRDRKLIFALERLE